MGPITPCLSAKGLACSSQWSRIFALANGLWGQGLSEKFLCSRSIENTRQAILRTPEICCRTRALLRSAPVVFKNFPQVFLLVLKTVQGCEQIPAIPAITGSEIQEIGCLSGLTVWNDHLSSPNYRRCHAQHQLQPLCCPVPAGLELEGKGRQPALRRRSTSTSKVEGSEALQVW